RSWKTRAGPKRGGAVTNPSRREVGPASANERTNGERPLPHARVERLSRGPHGEAVGYCVAYNLAPCSRVNELARDLATPGVRVSGLAMTAGTSPAAKKWASAASTAW